MAHGSSIFTKGIEMAGTRTAPQVNGTPNVVQTTLHLMDASGDIFTDAITTTTLPGDTEIEAWAAAYQAATHATLYKVSVTSEYEGEADPDNATTGSRDSRSDGINLLYKNITTLRSVTPRLIAPVPAVMQGNQDIPLLTSTEMTALILAELALLVGFQLQSAQYTERRERSNNPRIKA